MTEKRLTPEALLAQIQEENREAKPGKLKIFLGAAPGVGKTYSMLQEAMARQEDGTKVLVGIAETHGRQETAEMLEGLEVLPRKKIEYQSKLLEEFDIDTALERHPELILIDEMAHTNVPGSRHTKRWQDIKELLDCGIDVYTTLNIQHLESLNDIVNQITGIRIRETVPDSAIEEADKIELVDLPPDDLLKRLEEGKVYIKDQAVLAKQHFFRKGNLTALRELALRVMAEQVNAQVLSHRKSQAITETWPTSERLLVCIGPGSGSAKLVRAAKRMASYLHAEWFAVYVESPKLHLTDAQKNSANQNLKLAEQLGGEAIVLTGEDLVEEILDLARSRNVTKIMISKHIKPHWKNLFRGSLTDQLIRRSGEIDIYVIRADSPELADVKHRRSLKRTTAWSTYLFATVIVSVLSVAGYFMSPFLELSNMVMLYLLGVVIVAGFGRRGPSTLASVLSVLLFDFFFVEPRFSFAIGDTQYLFTLAVMLLVGLLISHLTILIRQQAERARLREQRITALHALSRQLASHRGIQQLLQIATMHIASVFDGQVIALLPEHSKLIIIASHPILNHELSPKEQSVAQWVYDMGQTAGLGTQTLPFAEALYLPLTGSKGTLGVIGIKPNDSKRLLLTDQMRLLQAFINQTTLVLEVDQLQAQALSAKKD
ncbi:MAG: kdpD [Gammaproteobacteria bacterium]|jgi:two-component system sensor histidine kinase KdpD|nr:kdpD [Gammaproteobacteria bacterium]